MVDHRFSNIIGFPNPPAAQGQDTIQNGGILGGVLDGGPGGPHPPGMEERLTKVEAAVGRLEIAVGKVEIAIGGLRNSQNLTVGMLGIFAAAVIAMGVYTLQRIDRADDHISALSDKVDALPGLISADLRDITKTLAESITAAKQQPPQVILMAVPQGQPAAPQSK